MKTSICAKKWTITVESEPKSIHSCILKVDHEGPHSCGSWHLIGTNIQYKCNNTSYYGDKK